jgi:geranylgeranyl transferase type-2 subunit beta
VNYLQDMTIRLAVALNELPEETRQRHIAFLTSAQQADGGFAGRDGGSDPYYTSFALRSLAMLGQLYGPLAERAAQFLRSRLTEHESLIDLISLIFAAALLENAAGIDIFADVHEGWRDAMATTLRSLRRSDGGFAKTPAGAASSTYHTFLALICLQLIERPIEEPDEIARFITSQRDGTGGFLEVRAAKRAGTNPTAAAIGVLRMLGRVDEPTRLATIEFLAEMQNEEGGLLANSRIPLADVLSTFTGLWTLADLDGLEAIDHLAALKFVQSLEQPDGGFVAAIWDSVCDVEYTFYGLGTSALLQTIA